MSAIKEWEQSGAALPESTAPVQVAVIIQPAAAFSAQVSLLERLERGEYPQLQQIVFVAHAAPLTQRVPPSKELSEVAQLAQRYQALAAARGLKLLVCGQAAEHYGLRAAAARAEGVELTGFMELAALLEQEEVRAGRAQVLVW